MAEEERVIKKKSVNLPRNNVGVTIGYVLLAILLPPLAVYLDGGSSFSVVANLLLWLFAPFLGVVQGIVYVLRTKAHRSVSQPARYRLWLKYGDGNDMAATVLTGQTTNVTDDGASTVSNHFSGKKRRIGKIHRESSKAAHPRNTITGVNTNPELGREESFSNAPTHL
ncbi:hypothetical protein P154DRAFT_517348 [Amniculicola lignicola CBS 123094]|uniref:Uncharacterized protein n=1 Tax=Amniculicola lignicola CBS 123094 TaxID=1392246 RepID=A0A6A5WYH3_9PLEO|nr:hypothetical protein P154DRAFT_517348 [Amniculicola lignicola CBS 123094]